MLRDIKTGLLVKKAIVYRIFVVITQILIMWLITNDWYLSAGFSIIWNIINTLEYFGFDYIFARLYKVGKWLIGNGNGTSLRRRS